MRAVLGFAAQIAVSAALIAAGVALWAGRGAITAYLGLAAPAPEDGGGQGPSAGVPVVVAPVELRTDDLVLEMVGTGRARRSITLRADAGGKIAEMALSGGRAFAAGEVMVRLESEDQRLALRLAEARLAEAERVLARFETLESQAITSTARLTEARTAREVAAIELEQARAAF